MKCFLPLVRLIFTAYAQANGPSIPLLEDEPVNLPNRFVFMVEGIRYVRPNTSEVIQIAWRKIDVVRLAEKDPELNRLRKKVLLLGKREMVEFKSEKKPWKNSHAVPPYRLTTKMLWPNFFNTHASRPTRIESLRTRRFHLQSV